MKKALVVVAVLLAALGGALAEMFSAAPLPAPAVLTEPLPVAAPPAEMAAFRLPTGVSHRNAGVAYRGGALSEKRDFSVSSVLVKHPRGDVLIDTGFGRAIERDLHLGHCTAPLSATGCSDGVYYAGAPFLCSGDEVTQSACMLRYLIAQGYCG